MDDLAELTVQLVETDSVNPALVPGGKGEREIALLVAEWCDRRGLEVELVGDDRPSVVATRRGSGGGRSLLLNTHLDTVGVAGMAAPHVARVEDGRLHFVPEPTDLQLAVAHRGFVGFELETQGVAAHGSRPDLGVDAIVKMGHIVALEDLDERLTSGPRHPLAGTGSVRASLIEGGQELSSFPARCLLTVERRTIPGETAADVGRELLERERTAAEWCG
jgi:acetylornithine deacetylase/succinyl-diaminopimelate desuccinylase-like protein